MIKMTIKEIETSEQTPMLSTWKRKSCIIFIRNSVSGVVTESTWWDLVGKKCFLLFSTTDISG
jgi:hypothetical protein